MTATERVFVPCARCGLIIEVVDPDLIPQVGQRPVQVFHEACQTPTPPRRFMVKVGVYEMVPPEGVLSAPGTISNEQAEQLRQRWLAGAEPASVVPLEGTTEVTAIPVEEELVSFSAKADAANFVSALGDLERRLGELWLKVVEHAPLVDGLDPAKDPE